MDNKPSKKRPPPFTIRLSKEQRNELNRRSADVGLSVAGYIKFAALDESPRKFKRPHVDRVLLAQLIAHLGRVGSNVNQLAKQINSNSYIEVHELQKALNELIEMKYLAMQALGCKATDLEPQNRDGER